ncbi:hypothetical protein Taro_030581 [Colocasia esculenta]|uniref:DUF4283 domain-containing protein n=1 Tax=Colocasia esculenta TaxID=4460 RepID=A0A843VYC2_COLES|nr:hypothetical protein [Colocasia esculenta]
MLWSAKDMECVDATSKCVDTLSQTGIIGSLGRVTSVDTTSDSVDTLSRTAKQVFWELDLVSTLLEPVSTLPCRPTRLDLPLDQHCCNHELLLFFYFFFSFFFSFFFPWWRCSAPLDEDALFPLKSPFSRMVLLECVDTTSECVDTLSQTGIIGSLGRVTSVDTTSGSVDTLSRTAKQNSRERSSGPPRVFWWRCRPSAAMAVAGGPSAPSAPGLSSEDQRPDGLVDGPTPALTLGSLAPAAAPALDGGLSFARVVAASLVLPDVPTTVHEPAFTDKGEPAVFFSREEMEVSLVPFKFSVVAKTAYGRPPIPEICSHLISRCGIKDSFLISALANWHLLLRFKSQDDYLRVLLRESLHVQGKLFRFFKWSPLFKLSEEPSIIPVWIDFPALLVSLFQKNLLSSIAANVGPVLQIAHTTELLINTKAARVCVELDLLKPRPDRIWIGMGDLGGFWQEVAYLNLPKYCCVCRRIRHDRQKCRSVKDQAPVARVPPVTNAAPLPTKVWVPVAADVHKNVHGIPMHDVPIFAHEGSTSTAVHGECVGEVRITPGCGELIASHDRQRKDVPVSQGESSHQDQDVHGCNSGAVLLQGSALELGSPSLALHGNPLEGSQDDGHAARAACGSGMVGDAGTLVGTDTHDYQDCSDGLVQSHGRGVECGLDMISLAAVDDCLMPLNSVVLVDRPRRDPVITRARARSEERGDGSSVNFYKDTWIGPSPLIHVLRGNPSLAQESHNIMINEMVLDINNPVWSFLNVSPSYVHSLLSTSQDKFIWAANPQGNFTVKSAYDLDVSHGVSRGAWAKLWHHAIPPRAAMFAWHLLHRAVPVLARIKLPVLVKWTPPQVDFCLNVDGASNGNPGYCGGGGCIRDSHGNFICGFAFFYGSGSSILAEARALHDGLQLAINRQLQISVVFSDSATLLRAIAAGCVPHWV